MGKEESPSSQFHVEIKQENYEVDYALEYVRLVEAMKQLLYELRVAHRVGEVYDAAMFASAEVAHDMYKVTSNADGHVRIKREDEGYVFEAEHLKLDATPVLREYRVDGDEMIEITPGQDGAGCLSLAWATQVLMTLRVATITKG